jgi:hypothetical protein
MLRAWPERGETGISVCRTEWQSRRWHWRDCARVLADFDRSKWASLEGTGGQRNAVSGWRPSAIVDLDALALPAVSVPWLRLRLFHCPFSASASRPPWPIQTFAGARGRRARGRKKNK